MFNCMICGKQLPNDLHDIYCDKCRVIVDEQRERQDRATNQKAILFVLLMIMFLLMTAGICFIK
jgi:predicted nucleic acid-binding Zn ribbon protein